MNADELINKLGDAIGIDLSFNAEGTCSVIFDKDEVDFEKNENKIFIIGTVQTNLKKDIELYRTLLTSNYLGIHTGFCTLSIDDKRNELILHRLIEENTDFDAFEKSLVLFIKALRYWKNWISEENENSASTFDNSDNTNLDLLRTGVISI
jgi:hypothetical protein